jgi:hypothetical protein
MKRLYVLGLVCAISCCLHAQVVETTVCDILRMPSTFDGKMVKIKGTAVTGFDQFIVKDGDCGLHVNAIWLSYPEGTKAKAGPAALLQMQPAANFSGTVAAVQRTPVTLEKSKDFKQFDSLLATQAKTGAMCLGCPRYEVSATMVGRLDGVVAKLTRDKSGKVVSWKGFGNLNAYHARLVLQSVSDVTPKEIDYSKVAALKDDTAAPAPAPGASAPDPADANRNAVKAFGAGTPGGDTLQRVADAFFKTGQKAGTNGVIVYNGNLNEAAAKDEAKGAKESPDGILYLCGYNAGKLSDSALVRASAHQGSLIADLRDPQKGFEEAGIYEMEFRAWNAAELSVAAYGQKIVILPGGYLLWNAEWPAADRGPKATENMNGYLKNWKLLAR